MVLYARVDHEADSPAPRVGIIVSKAVGNAVTRNKVKRRLRALAAQSLDGIPTRAAIVVRALPPAAEARWEQLGADYQRALNSCLRRSGLAGTSQDDQGRKTPKTQGISTAEGAGT